MNKKQRREAFDNAMQDINDLFSEKCKQIEEKIRENNLKGMNTYYRGVKIETAEDFFNMNAGESDPIKILSYDVETATP